MIPKPVARPELVRSSVYLRSETAKPTKPASGKPPLPVADSSRISPPAPVAAPGMEKYPSGGYESQL